MRHRSSPLFYAGIAALALASPLRGQDQPAPSEPAVVLDPPALDEPAVVLDQQQAETLGYRRDVTDRMTVPVAIEGRGPYRFVVDTGAERTVISRELARELELSPGRTATVHSMTEVSRIATVIIPGLRIGTRTVSDIHAPALARADLGAPGMLGVDSLRSQRVLFDFGRREMTITPSRRAEERWPEGTIVVTGRRVFGRLVLVDAEVEGTRVWVIVDSGSQVSVANSALRRRLERRGRIGPTFPIRLTSITGGEVGAEIGVAREIRIGGVDIRDLPIAFADVHPFRQLGLMNRPALLLGMDALQLFERVSIDFANRRVKVLLPESSEHAPETQVAGGAEANRIAG